MLASAGVIIINHRRRSQTHCLFVHVLIFIYDFLTLCLLVQANLNEICLLSVWIHALALPLNLALRRMRTHLYPPVQDTSPYDMCHFMPVAHTGCAAAQHISEWCAEYKVKGKRCPGFRGPLCLFPHLKSQPLRQGSSVSVISNIISIKQDCGLLGSGYS